MQLPCHVQSVRLSSRAPRGAWAAPTPYICTQHADYKLKGIVLQGSLTGPNRFVDSKPVGAIAFHSGQKITDCE